MMILPSRGPHNGEEETPDDTETVIIALQVSYGSTYTTIRQLSKRLMVKFLPVDLPAVGATGGTKATVAVEEREDKMIG